MARPKQVSDEDLVATARRVFLEKGPQVSVGVIARRLKVSPASIFHRVRTKNKLLVLALWPADPPELLQLQRAPLPEGDSAKEQLIALLTGLNAYFATAVPALFLLVSAGVPMKPTKARGKSKDDPMQIRLRAALAQWLVRGGAVPSAAALAAADTLLGAIEARYMHVYLGGIKSTPAADRKYVRDLVELVL
jgi:AcrR family transcriptional regulator